MCQLTGFNDVAKLKEQRQWPGWRLAALLNSLVKEMDTISYIYTNTKANFFICGSKPQKSKLQHSFLSLLHLLHSNFTHPTSFSTDYTSDHFSKWFNVQLLWDTTTLNTNHDTTFCSQKIRNSNLIWPNVSLYLGGPKSPFLTYQESGAKTDNNLQQCDPTICTVTRRKLDEFFPLF